MISKLAVYTQAARGCRHRLEINKRYSALGHEGNIILLKKFSSISRYFDYSNVNCSAYASEGSMHISSPGGENTLMFIRKVSSMSVTGTLNG